MTHYFKSTAATSVSGIFGRQITYGFDNFIYYVLVIIILNCTLFLFQTIRENWNLKYSAVYVLCLLSKTGVKPKDTIGATVAVIATADAATPPSNLLTVLDTKPKPGVEVRLSLTHLFKVGFYLHTFAPSS